MLLWEVRTRPLWFPGAELPAAKERIDVRRPHIPMLAQISVAHLVSHVYIMAIPALLPLLPDALGVTFVELGAAVSLFNVMSATCQIPMGFIVDRFGARRVLVLGIGTGTASFFLLSLFPSYVGLLVAAGVLGASNAVYHPSDYAILSRSMRETIMGKAFSVHSFAGYGGSAATPFLMVSIATLFSISGAFFAAGTLGTIVLAMFFLAGPEKNVPVEPAPPQAPAGAPKGNMAVFTLPVLVLTGLYVLLSLSTASIERFSVSALMEGYGVTLPLANTALTAFLICSAVGVLSGGELADRTRRHGFVAAVAFGVAAVLTVVVALGDLPPLLLVVLFALIGFLTGVIVPSRDMLVRAASPKGGEGKTFGVVSSGFNIGGTIGPLLCGYFLDHGLPSFVFWATVAFMVLTVLVTWAQESRRGCEPERAGSRG
ncbi:Major facilitator superfamily MFS_1 [uncultured delta proteobacterium]|uniref:Major facilitator superfamily MFS_1 n=1 Tax=uncultured delta proteobacterium TaxID=34034 RepID=A0A212IXK8_9DELT|nr:Major facilitator superfamily MFS_1 [uncultured delta proteobacterium]